MSDTVLIILAVVVICGAGLAFAVSKIDSKEEDELQTETKRLFPDGRLQLLPLCRGGFGAILTLPGRTYQMLGDYLEEEGGDGYFHIHCERGPQKIEIQRFPLRMFRQHRPLILHSIRWLSGYEEGSNQATEPTPTAAPRRQARLI